MTLSRSTAYDEHPDAGDLAAAEESRAPAWAREQLEVIRELRDMGMSLARNLTRRVLAETEAIEAAAEAGEPEPAPRRGAVVDPALSFSRISRAVRLTLALEAQTHRQIEDAAARRDARARAANDDGLGDDDLPADARWEDAIAGSLTFETVRRNLRRHFYADKDHEIRRAVEETIEATSDDPDEVERLRGELTERLEDEEDVFECRFTWPIGEAIALICQDLGIEPDWDRWETRPWAVKEAEESPKGSPYATRDRSNEPFTTGTYWYRKARRLYPVDQLPPLRAARGPP
jgi:hypothetical protein